jgi:hypothetical protein
MLQDAPAVAGSSARLYLDEIGAPVVARVTHRAPDRLTVRRALPFLKLHSSVHDEGGRRAQVASVSVVIEDGMPELVLELAYERESAAEAAPEPTPLAAAVCTATSADEAAPTSASLSAPVAAVSEPAPTRPSRRDETVPYVFDRAAREPQERAPRLASKREATLQFVTVRASLREGEPALLFESPRPWVLALRWMGFAAAAFVQVLGRSFARLTRASA